MIAPVYRPTLSTGETIVIDLVELVSFDEIGGSVIQNYLVEISEGESGIWNTIAGSPSLDLQVSVSGLTIGLTYKFRSQAENINGWGLTSEDLSVLSTSVPD